jgi:hypothetical protein
LGRKEEECLLFLDFLIKFLNDLKPLCNHKINVNDGGCQNKGYSWVVLCLDSLSRDDEVEKMNSKEIG